MNREGAYACGWHRDRGPAVCGSTLRVPRHALEKRVLGALCDRVLTPESARLVVERAFGLVSEAEQGGAVPERELRARLEDVEKELENLVRLAAKLGDLDAHGKVLGELRAERAALREQL